MRLPILYRYASWSRPARTISSLSLAVACLGPGAARAQVAEGLSSKDPATGGKTDVAQEGFAAAGDREAAENNDTTEFRIAGGGLVSVGNSRMLAMTGSSQLRVRREAHQLSLAAAANVARAAIERDERMEQTVENYQGNARYDYFLSRRVALFLAASARRDPFQGLDLRLNLDPGLAYYFVDQEKHRLWGELGYDLQYDVRRDENLAEAEAEGILLEKTDVRHSSRVFAGYDVTMNDAVTLTTGIEYLQGIPDTEYWRLNWNWGVNSALEGGLSVATTMSLRYDNHPLPGIEETDIVTAFNLVYQLL